MSRYLYSALPLSAKDDPEPGAAYLVPSDASPDRRRLGGIQLFLQYGDQPRIPLASDQLAQIRDLISQARAALAALMTPK